MTLKQRLKSRIKYIAQNSTLHGVNFLASDAHICYKVIWLAVLVWFAYTMEGIILTTLEHSKDDSIAINIDTAYLKWNNKFPTVALCFRKDRNFDNLANFLDDYFRSNKVPKPANKRSYYRFAQSYAFVSPARPITSISIDMCLPYNETCGLNLDVIQSKAMPATCTDFLSEVTWLGKKRPCHEIFKLEHTTIGLCYTTSQIKKPLIYSRAMSHDIQLKIEYLAPEGYGLDLYVYSPGETITSVDVPYPLPKDRSMLYLSILTVETINHPEVKSVAPSIRNCRFADEKTDLYKFPYSFANCNMERRIKQELDQCNCTLPMVRKKNLNFCNVTGLMCLKDANEAEKLNKHAKTNDACLHLCTEMEVTVTGNYIKELPEMKDRGRITIEVMSQPSMRYVRSLMTTNLDIIVICASIVGLFTGASLLSLLELFYMFIIRKYIGI